MKIIWKTTNELSAFRPHLVFTCTLVCLHAARTIAWHFSRIIRKQVSELGNVKSQAASQQIIILYQDYTSFFLKVVYIFIVPRFKLNRLVRLVLRETIGSAP